MLNDVPNIDKSERNSSSIVQDFEKNYLQCKEFSFIQFFAKKTLNPILFVCGGVLT